MQPELERIAEDMIEAIQRGVPEYGPAAGTDAYRGHGSRRAVHARDQPVRRAHRQPPRPPRKRTGGYVPRDRAHPRRPRGATSNRLQMALRLGARVAWRGFLPEGQQRAGNWTPRCSPGSVRRSSCTWTSWPEPAPRVSRPARAEVVGELERAAAAACSTWWSPTRLPFPPTRSRELGPGAARWDAARAGVAVVALRLPGRRTTSARCPPAAARP